VPGWNLKYNYIIKTIQFMHKPYMHKVSVGYSLGNMPVFRQQDSNLLTVQLRKSNDGFKGQKL